MKENTKKENPIKTLSKLQICSGIDEHEFLIRSSDFERLNVTSMKFITRFIQCCL